MHHTLQQREHTEILSVPVPEDSWQQCDASAGLPSTANCSPLPIPHEEGVVYSSSTHYFSAWFTHFSGNPIQKRRVDESPLLRMSTCRGVGPAKAPNCCQTSFRTGTDKIPVRARCCGVWCIDQNAVVHACVAARIFTHTWIFCVCGATSSRP